MRRAFTIVAVALAIGLATAVSPWASPDGLERVAQDEGFAHAGKLHAIQDDAPVPDYERAAAGRLGRQVTGQRLQAGFAVASPSGPAPITTRQASRRPPMSATCTGVARRSQRRLAMGGAQL